MTASEWVGTLRFLDVGMGAWVLEAGGGKVALYGPIPAELKDRRVRVFGRRVEVFGYGMVGGAAIEVQRVEGVGA